MRKLVPYGDDLAVLNDLKGEGHIRGTRHAWHVAVGFRQVCRRPVGKVLLLAFQCPRLIRKLIAVHNAPARWHTESGSMILNVPGSCIEDLPNPVEIWLAVRSSRYVIRSRAIRCLGRWRYEESRE